MSNIDILVEAGPDAFTNLYDVRITFPEKVLSPDRTDVSNAISVRTASFTPPSFTLGEYDIFYKAIKLKRFAPKINIERRLSLPIRIDAGWYYYELFKQWKKLYMDESISQLYFSNFLNSLEDTQYHGKIDVFAYKTSDALQDVVDVNNLSGEYTGPIWTFENVVCLNVTEPTFTRDTATAIELTVEFLYGKHIPPEKQPNQREWGGRPVRLQNQDMPL